MVEPLTTQRYVPFRFYECLFEPKALHDAAQSGNIEEVRRLLVIGQQPNAFDDLGKTPLHYAVEHGYLEVLGLIGSLIAIRLGVFGGPEQQAFAGLLVLLSVGTIGVSIFGLVLTMWSAFVSTYLQSQAWKFEAAEATEHIQMIVESVVVAASASAIARANTPLAQTSLVNEALVRAVSKAVARAAAADTDEMISAFREATGER